MPDNGVITEINEIERLIELISQNVKWVRRTQAELDSELIQVVSVAAILCNGEILVSNIRGHKQGRMQDKNSVWAGGSVRKSDRPKQTRLRNMFRRCLSRELDEELGLSVDFTKLLGISKSTCMG